uniref:Proline rich 33 n=1 Tax=Gasterosteus aculeatus aculeatus TaxID=481459 RepID=A0AAQ4PAK6_GASAC|nr:proteoglycan 4 [Gasterosteus aculeatus aculeatus]
MAVAYRAHAESGLLSQHYPPPLLPKPRKDNARLQKLLKRTAKKKASSQASQPAALFRSSLSPVNEASPDLEHSDHSTPPKTPEAPFGLHGIQPPPRFTVRPLYQHVASPYPRRTAFGRGAKCMPPAVGTPSHSQHITTVSSYSTSIRLTGDTSAPGPVAELAVAQMSPTCFIPEATIPADETKKPAFSMFAETHVIVRPGAAGETPKTKSTGPTPHSAVEGQAGVRSLTVLTLHGKCKSPRPTFKATDHSRSPRPMFDVPQIRMYTASTSYYESSRTPPVYDTAGLTAIGSTVPQSKTPTETKPDLTSASAVRRDTTPTQLPLIVTDPARKTPTSEIKRGTKVTADITVITPKAETKRATPTFGSKRASPMAGIKGATATAESVKTPTSEFQTPPGRPRTPAYHLSRATTPVFEVSRPNPLLFAVSPITVEPEKSRTPHIVPAMVNISASQSIKALEPKPTETILNGDIHSEIAPAVKPIQQSITKSKSEPDLTRGTASPVSRRPNTLTAEPKTLVVIPHCNQRPKTPTYEASRLMTTSPGYKRPRTPTHRTSPFGVSPVAFQRPKTPTQVTQKSNSGYRGLTPAEYAAYGGIRTYSPAFGIFGSKTQTEEEGAAAKEESAKCKTTSQEPSIKKPKEPPKDVDKPHMEAKKDTITPSIPTIIVSQASDASRTTSKQKTSTVFCQTAEEQAKTVIQKIAKAPSPAAEGKSLEKKKVETQVREVAKPKMTTSEAKHPAPNSDEKDPLKAVRKLFGKDKGQESGTETKDHVSDKKELAKPVDATRAKGEGCEQSTAVLPAKTSAVEPTGSKGKDTKAESALLVKSALEKKEGDESLLAKPLLKVMQRPEGVKSKLSGWSRLKKHMVVEQEEPKFPDISTQKETTRPEQSDAQKAPAEKASDEPVTPDENQPKDAPVATKMWEAVLFQMFSTKENIMHQIELNKSDEEKDEGRGEESKEVPSFAHRLPVLLFSPRFDAKRLKEAASRPVTKISTVFEMGLIGRKVKDEEPKDFNRTARGFAAT